MGGIVEDIFGGGETIQTTNVPPMTAEERELVGLQSQLAKKQLAQVDLLAPFQKKLLEATLADLERQSKDSAALDAAISPEERAAMQKSDFDRAKKLGPIQDQILEMQLANMRGELTPAQQKAVEAGIEAGYGDIDRATSKGIGLISDELANARGLRLTDTPILREATMLSQAGLEQKASLAKNLRSQAMFQLPGQSSAIGLGQQNIAEAAKQFQADLRQRAFQNRLALTGNTSQTGIGLASIGNPAQTLSALTSSRLANTGTTTSKSAGLGEIGALAGGIGGLITAFSDRRLKSNVVKVDDDERGVGIYEYTKFGRRKRGVMADEVVAVSPDAVTVHPSGYGVVDYGKI